MPKPVLIDTDMGVDDAVAITLALCTDVLDLVGVTSVGGNVTLDQATRNAAALLHALCRDGAPPLACGLDQNTADLEDACHVFGTDGLGGVLLEIPESRPLDLVDTYEQLIESHGQDLHIVAIGPLTNLAHILHERPGLLERAGRIVIMGGAMFRKGNVTPTAEFNFYRDPAAAKQVLSAGLPTTLVPLDVTTQVLMDESHVAHLARSGTRSGELLAEMIGYPLSRELDSPPGTFVVHDALAVGCLIWPEMFIRSGMAVEVVIEGAEAGRSKPAVTRDPKRKISVVMSLSVVDFMENLLETLCHEKFVV